MSLYDFLITTYNGFIAIFPGPLQWLITLLIIIGLISAMVVLIRHHILFIIILIILLPFVVPVLVRFVSDIYHFILHLLELLHLVSPSLSS